MRDAATGQLLHLVQDGSDVSDKAGRHGWLSTDRKGSKIIRNPLTGPLGSPIGEHLTSRY